MTYIIITATILVLCWIYLTKYGNKQIQQFADLAEIEFQKGDYLKSIEILDEGIKTYPGAYMLYNNRGNAKYQLELYEEALIDFELSIRWNNSESRNPKAFGNRMKTLTAIALRDLHNGTKYVSGDTMPF